SKVEIQPRPSNREPDGPMPRGVAPQTRARELRDATTPVCSTREASLTTSADSVLWPLPCPPRRARQGRFNKITISKALPEWATRGEVFQLIAATGHRNCQSPSGPDVGSAA